MAETSESNEISTEPAVDIIKMQQEFYEMFGHSASIIYDCYADKEALEVKIDLIVPEMNAAKKTALIDLVWTQRRFMGNKHLYMSPIFVCCTYDADIKGQITYPLDIQSKEFTIHPVFRIQKCLATLKLDKCSTKCCALFVDEFGRVYANWQDFREKNKYEDGLVIAPRNGIYNGSAEDAVLLDIFVRRSGLTRNLDTGSTVVGLASAGVGVATLIPTIVVAPAIAAGAAVAGISCALYTGIRSAYDLYDRKNHKQSIALKDKEARASWFNIGAGMLSASAAGATQLITAAQSGQNISHLTRSTIRFMNIGAISLHTTGCIEGLHTMIHSYYCGQPISKIHLAQLSASLFLLTHSISNFQTAEQLLRSSDSDDPNTIKQFLCKTLKAKINHLCNETALVRGLTNDIPQIIVRSLKSMGDPKELVKYIESQRDLIEKKTAETDDSEPPSTEPSEAARDAFLEKQDDFHLSVVPAVAAEYVDMFDRRLDSITDAILADTKCHDRSQLNLVLIHLLDEFTWKLFDIFLDFAKACVLDTKHSDDIEFDSFLKLIYDQLMRKFTEQASSWDLNSFMMSLSGDSSNQHISFVRDFLNEQTIASTERAVKAYDLGHPYKTELSETRKVLLALEERVEQLSTQFQPCCTTAGVQELAETIKDILKRLSFGSATVFFALAKRLLKDHAMNIQLSLGRFISIDIFLTDIYCLLTRICADNEFASLNEYLFQYTDDLYDGIEVEFKLNYILGIDESLKRISCNVCAGEVFV